MSQGMSRQRRISSRMLLAGFVFFAVYGILATVFRELSSARAPGTTISYSADLGLLNVVVRS